MARRKSRTYCFTVNNYTDDEYETLKSSRESIGARYIVFGREVGENNTPHLQGYVYFTNPRSLSGVKRLPGLTRAHLEIAKGTPNQASEYCKKDGDFFEEGDLPAPGRRSDLEEIKEKISEGKSELFIADNHFSQWVVYRRSFDAYRRLLRSTPRSWKTWTNILVGSTGLGKTRFVYQQHRDEDIFVWGGDRWFDGYCGQSIALLDDYRGELTIGFMLRLLDRYPLSVPIKGGFVNWNPRRCYITSNHMPEFWYEDVDRPSMDALNRRVDRLDIIDKPIFEN